MLIPIIVALFVAGGTSIAAENALPGEFLYLVKVDVNEKVFDLVSVTSKAQAAADLGHAQERLQEAEKLAAEKHLDAKTSAEINARLQAHLKGLNTQATKMSEAQDSTGALTVHSDLGAALKAHGRILASVKGEDTEEQDALDSIRIVVGVHASSTLQDLLDAEVKVSVDQRGGVKSAAEGKLKAAENKIAEVRSFIENKKASSTAQVSASAEAQIQLAEDKVASGKVKLAAEAYGGAFNDFQSALRIAQTAKFVGEAEDEFDLSIDDNVEVEIGNEEQREGTKNGENGNKNEERESGVEIKGGLRVQSTSTPSSTSGGDNGRAEGDGDSDDGVEAEGQIKVNVKF